MLSCKLIVTFLLSAVASAETKTSPSLMTYLGVKVNKNYTVPANHVWTGAPGNFAAVHSLQKDISFSTNSFSHGEAIIFLEETKNKFHVQRQEIEMEKVCLMNCEDCQVTLKIPKAELPSISITKLQGFTPDAYFNGPTTVTDENKCISGGEFSFQANLSLGSKAYFYNIYLQVDFKYTQYGPGHYVDEHLKKSVRIPIQLENGNCDGYFGI